MLDLWFDFGLGVFDNLNTDAVTKILLAGLHCENHNTIKQSSNLLRSTPGLLDQERPLNGHLLWVGYFRHDN